MSERPRAYLNGPAAEWFLEADIRPGSVVKACMLTLQLPQVLPGLGPYWHLVTRDTLLLTMSFTWTAAVLWRCSWWSRSKVCVFASVCPQSLVQFLLGPRAQHWL